MQSETTSGKNQRPSALQRGLRIAGMGSAAFFAVGELPTFAEHRVETGVPTALITGGVLGTQEALNADPIQIENSADVVSHWDEGNLFIKGDVNMSASRQQALASWIAEEHPNWTVVVMDSARRESYRDPAGGNHRGTMAAHYRLFTELPANTGFNELIDERTGQPNGAILLIVTDDRQNGLNFKATGVYDDNGLGEHNWLRGATLIDLARPGMRDALNTDRAVRETIEGVDGRLNQKLAEAARRHAQALESATTSLQSATENLGLLETQLTTFRNENPELTGDIARPDLDPLRDALAQAQRDLEAENFRGCSSNAQNVKDQVEQHLRLLADYPAAGEELDQLELAFAKAQELNTDEAPINAISATGRALVAAQQAWARGDSSYSTLLSRARGEVEELPGVIRGYYSYGEGMDALEEAIADARNDKYAAKASEHFEAAEEALRTAREEWESGDTTYKATFEHAESALEEAKSTMSAARAWAVARGTTIGLIASGLTLGTGLFLFGAYRRARRREEQAEKLVQHWKKHLRTKPQGLLDLDGERQRWVGKSRNDIRYTGETRELAEQAYTDSVNVIPMLQLARARLAKAEELLKPSPSNIFSAKNYDEAIGLLGEDKFDFDAENDIELELEDEAGETTRLSARAEDLNAIKGRSFDEMMDDFYTTAERAEVNIKAIKDARLAMSTVVSARDSRILDLEGDVTSLATRGQKDGLFKLASLGGAFLPGAEAKRDEIKTLGRPDPVKAAKLAKESRPAIDAADNVANTILAARETLIPGIHTVDETLRNASLAPDWINDRLAQLSEQADAHVAALSHDKPPAKTLELTKELQDLSTRAQTALTLDSERREKAAKAIEDATRRVRTVRSKIATKLGIAEDQVLHETDNDPDDFLERARNSHERVAEAISEGDLPRAQVALSELYQATEGARNLVTNTERAFEVHKKNVRNLRGRETTLDSRKTKNALTLAKLQKKYGEAAFRLGEGDATHPNADGTVANNIKEIARAMRHADKAIQLAELQHSQGRILEATLSAERANELYLFVDHRLNEITEKEERLKEALQANTEAVASLDSFASRLAPVMQEKQTWEETREEYKLATEALRVTNFLNAAQAGSLTYSEGEITQLEDALSFLKHELQRSEIASFFTEEELTTIEDVVGRIKDNFESETATTKTRKSIREELEGALNPFMTEDKVTLLRTAFTEVETQAARDREEYREAKKSILAGLKQLRDAEAKLAKMLEDEIPDSLKIGRVEGQLPRLRIKLKALQKRFNDGKHDDWYEIDDEADESYREAANYLDILKGQEQEGREAMRAIQRARQAVKRLGTFRSNYRVSIDTSEGKRELKRARQQLLNGDYSATAKMASSAVTQAESEWSRASSREEREHEAEQARIRAAEARRARERAARRAAERAAAASRAAARRRSRSSFSSSSSMSSGGSSGGFSSMSSGGSSGGW